MASLIYLDTHVVAWLFAGELKRIPAKARNAINRNDLLISPMVLVELQFLIEIGRFTAPVTEVVETLGQDIGLKTCDLPFEQVARGALELTWTRDPFDRLIVSQAALRETSLVTTDRKIRTHYPRTLWSDSAIQPDS